MRKFSLYLFLILLLNINLVYAEGDLWDNFGDTNIYGQKSVSDKEFDKALESKQGKKKKPDKNIPKGESFQKSNETDFILNLQDEMPVLLIPLPIQLDNNSVLPIGHYQIEGKKNGNEIYLNLYQAHNLMAKIPGIETNDDFGEDALYFVKLLPYGENQVQIIYGCNEFNAFYILNTANL